jgi:hypothetical protein
LTSGETLLLCGDGLTDMVGENEIASIIDAAKDVEECATDLRRSGAWERASCDPKSGRSRYALSVFRQHAQDVRAAFLRLGSELAALNETADRPSTHAVWVALRTAFCVSWLTPNQPQ